MPSPRPIRIRQSEVPRSRNRRFSFALFRFLLYGFVGIATEVIFYNIVKFGRVIPVVDRLFLFQWKVDPRLNMSSVWDSPLIGLYGQCSLWMMAVYAIAAFFLIEPIFRFTYQRPLLLRSALYGIAILLFEAVSGWALFWLTGYKIWFYDDRFNILGMTSLYILPVWMVTGMIVEVIYRELMDPDLVKALESPVPSTPDFGVGGELPPA